LQFSTSIRSIPTLPRGLVLILLLSLIWQTGGGAFPQSTFAERLPPSAAPWWPTRRRGRPIVRRFRRRFHSWRWLVGQLPRLLARATVLAVLLYQSGWPSVTRLSWGIVLLPVGQLVITAWLMTTPAHPGRGQRVRWLARLHRLYQLTLGLLLLSSLLRLLLGHPLSALAGVALPVGGGEWAPSAEADTDIRVTTSGEHHFEVTWRGTFQLVWEPRDGFEKWLLVLFVRRCHRLGETQPWLSQAQVAEAFGSSQTYVSRWERLVAEHGWHVLSDRFRHALNSLLPDAALSQAILQVWVPAFWLSAWDVRERLLQLDLLPDRAALTLEALHALAHHTGFQQVRALLLERFDLQAGHLFAREHWWLDQLLALNARLLTRLAQGERLTPQELVEVEPLRLKTSEKAAPNAPRPLASALHQTLFEPPAEPTPVAPEPIRCTYCGSAHTAPKSKRPRLKTVADAAAHKQVVKVLRYYCLNPDCTYQTFTHLPPGLLPHSPYPVQVRLVAVEVYAALLSTQRRSARMLAVKASTVYHWVASLSPAALSLAAYLGAVRTSGVVGLDDKWVRVCSPSAVRPHGQRPRAVWRYAYFAVDVYSADLLALELYPEHSDQAVRLFLLELKAKGLSPRVVVSDLDPAYGRMLPLIFPQAVHHECLFHAIQNALNQMTRVYGRHYVEKLPETLPLQTALTQLFQAHTEKTVRQRFAELQALRAEYVTRTPDIACVFDSLESHFPKLVNAIESSTIPRTNNATELVIRRFDQHYQGMCGFDSFESAQVYLRLFELVYRLTPFMEDNPGDKRGQSPLELAGYDLQALPIADFFAHLTLPALTLPAQPLSP
jgi:transposase-like protein/transcriptional regulator with XRE-family HTH domain